MVDDPIIEEVKKDESEDKMETEISNTEYTEVKEEDGGINFSCNHCQYKNIDTSNMKRHITRAHVKKEEGTGSKRGRRESGDDNSTPKPKKKKEKKQK